MLDYKQLTTNNTPVGMFPNNNGVNTNQPEIPLKYCLYARKSTESEERQVLSIDSQIKEMLDLASKEHMNIVEIKESLIALKKLDKG